MIHWLYRELRQISFIAASFYFPPGLCVAVSFSFDSGDEYSASWQNYYPDRRSEQPNRGCKSRRDSQGDKDSHNRTIFDHTKC